MKLFTTVLLFFLLFFIQSINAEKINKTKLSGEDYINVSTSETELYLEYNSPEIILEKIIEDLNYLHNNCVDKIDSRIMQKMAIEKLYELESLCMSLYYLIPVEYPNNDSIINHIDDEFFQELITILEDEIFTDDKISLLKLTVEDNYFIIDQLCTIMDTFEMDEDKVTSVRIVFPKIIDYSNSFKLITKVNFSDSKEEIQYIITGE